MAITTLVNYNLSTKQKTSYIKTGTRALLAPPTNTLAWYSMFELAGNPAAGTLAGTSTSAGVVPTSATAGYPSISAISADKYYISKIEVTGVSTTLTGCKLALYDRLWLGGAYSFNQNQVLSAQPSFSTRVPGGTDFKGLEIWCEQVTASTGIQVPNVSYTDDTGATGHSTTSVGTTAAQAIGRCWQLPLATGDDGVQTITNVSGGTATAGTFNVMVLRPLWKGRLNFALGSTLFDYTKTNFIQIFQTSALYLLISSDVAATVGTPELLIEIACG